MNWRQTNSESELNNNLRWSWKIFSSNLRFREILNSLFVCWSEVFSLSSNLISRYKEKIGKILGKYLNKRSRRRLQTFKSRLTIQDIGIGVLFWLTYHNVLILHLIIIIMWNHNKQDIIFSHAKSIFKSVRKKFERFFINNWSTCSHYTFLSSPTSQLSNVEFFIFTSFHFREHLPFSVRP